MKQHSLKGYLFVMIFLSIALMLILFSVITVNTIQSVDDARVNAHMNRYSAIIDTMFNSYQKDFLDDAIVATKYNSFDLEHADIIKIYDGTNVSSLQETSPDLYQSIIETNRVGIPTVSMKVISYNFLLENKINIPIRNIPSLYAFENGDLYTYDALAIVATIPTKDNIILYIDILNRDNTLLEKVKSVTGYETSVYLDNIVVATTKKTANDNQFIGISMHNKTYQSILAGEIVYTNEWNENWYRTVYVPLYDYTNIIGALSFSISEEQLVDPIMKNNNLLVFLGIIVAMILCLSLYLSFVLTRILIRPLYILIRSIDKADKGTYNKIYFPFEELNILSNHYNRLMIDLSTKKTNKPNKTNVDTSKKSKAGKRKGGVKK